MQILSALDAISPAFSRTKLVLFSPFRKGRTWKLAATAYLTMMSTIFVPYFLVGLFFIGTVKQMGGSTAVVILVSVCVIATMVYLLVFYLCSQLRFAFFDIVLNRGEFIAPIWRKYSVQSIKWTGFKVVLGTLVTAAVAAPLAAWIRHMIPVFAALQIKPGQEQSPQFMEAIFSFYGALFVVEIGFGIFYLVSSLLGDFIVPSLALEGTTLAEAFKRLGKLIRHEPGQFTLYAVLKVGLALAGWMAQTIAFYAVILVVGLVVALLALIVGFTLHALGVSSAVLGALGIALGVIVYLVLIFYVMFIAIGTVMTFLEAYSLYFLGGRYPMLGNLLDQSTPPKPTYFPPAAYPNYFAPPPPQA